ncbi:MAG: hypothetical protein DRO98_01205 [Archaeoglobales archaeon]|nr:MAG: hypothetical protein DRO98_01205 [Archaeoglobales archaeon]
MFSSGILDKLLGGGVEEGRIVLIETAGGVGEEIATGFVVSSLKEGKKALILLEKRRVRDVKKLIKDLKGEYELISPEDSDMSLEELYTIGDAIRRSSADLVVFFLLSPLLVIHSPENVFSFCTDMFNHIRARNALGVFTMDKTLSNAKTRAMFEEATDVVIEVEEVIEGFKIKRGIRIKKNPIAPPTDYYEIKFTEKGIEIGERIF